MTMGTKILGLISLIVTTGVFAQNERYSISVTSAYALSDFTNRHQDYINPNSTYSTDFRSTFNAGIEVRRQFGNKGFFLQSGFKWLGYGWKHTHNYSEWNGSAFEDAVNVNTTNLSYFTIPLIATYKFQRVIPGLTMSAGPQFSFVEFRKWKQDGEVLTADWIVPDLSMSMCFSLGYELELTERWLLGGELFSNLLPENVYNFGLGLSFRYIFKPIE
jgi:hypothetical protein